MNSILFREVAQFDGFNVDLGSWAMVYRGRKVRVEGQAGEILRLLVRADSGGLQPDVLAQQLWQGLDAEATKTRRQTAISRLRRRLEEVSDNTVDGRDLVVEQAGAYQLKGLRIRRRLRPQVLGVCFVLVATLSAVLLVLERIQPQGAADLTLRGVQAYEDREFGRARDLFEQAIAADSTYVRAYYHFAVAERFWGRSLASQDLMRRARRHLDRVSGALRQRIEAFGFLVQGDVGKAISLYERAMREHPYDVDVLIDLGNTFRLDLHEPERAIPLLERATAVDPARHDAFNALAYSYLQSGQTEKAIDAAEAYVRLRPESANAYDTLGDIVNSSDFARSVEYYEIAHNLDPTATFVTMKLAYIALFQARFDRAKDLYNSILSSEDVVGRARARLGLACLQLFRGQFQAVIPDLERDSRVDEEIGILGLQTATKRALIAYAAEALGDFETAHRNLKAIRSMEDDSRLGSRESWAFDCVRLYLAEGHLDSALTITRSLRPADEVAVPIWGWPRIGSEAQTALFQGRYKDAIDLARRALQLQSSQRVALSSVMSRALESMGDLEGALDVYDSSFEEPIRNWSVNPVESMRARLRMAVLAEGLGRLEEARRHYERYLAFWGTNEELARPAKEGLQRIVDGP